MSLLELTPEEWEARQRRQPVKGLLASKLLLRKVLTVDGGHICRNQSVEILIGP